MVPKESRLKAIDEDNQGRSIKAKSTVNEGLFPFQAKKKNFLFFFVELGFLQITLADKKVPKIMKYQIYLPIEAYL